MSQSLRIALLTHSTNPRGGVVHALSLADALVGLGHHPTIHAPDPTGAGFFRRPTAATVSVQAAPMTGSIFERVEARIEEYVRHFSDPARRAFDVYHAQDGISGNGLARLKAQGRIEGFGLTVHHVDAFEDARLNRLQTAAIEAADRLFVVSQLWQERLADRFGRLADIVGNGVDGERYTPRADGGEAILAGRLGLGTGPILLSVGGIEARKNTLTMLEAFALLRQRMRDAQWVIAGGASLLDHGAYQARFAARLKELDLPPSAVVEAGIIPDAVMPALYRLADVMVFASLEEGFGLAILEAMASGVPVVTGAIRPFTDYLSADAVVWCDPTSARSIADAVAAALAEPARAHVIASGQAVAGLHPWRNTARAHLPAYAGLMEQIHA